jgi:hypothetical protein
MHDKDCWYCASGSFTSMDGAIGAEVGYDWQAGSFVYGISGSVSSGPSVESNVWARDGFFESSLENMVAVRFRAGYAEGRNMFYTSFGVLSGAFEGRLAYDSQDQGADPTSMAVDDERRAGLGFGLGYATLIDGTNLALEVDGEYQMFQTGQNCMMSGYGDPTEFICGENDISDIGFGLSRAVLRVGVNYRF